MNKLMLILARFMAIFPSFSLMFGSIIPKWSSLSRLGKSKMLRSSYIWFILIPIIAKILSKVNHDISIVLFSTKINIYFGLPFNLKIFYLSSVSFAISSLIYQFRCPEIVKDYSSFTDFKSEGKTEEQIRSYYHEMFVTKKIKLLSILRIKDTTLKGDPGIFISKYLDTKGELAAGEEYGLNYKPMQVLDFLINYKIYQSKIADSFWYTRKHADSINTYARAICSIFYTVGFVLILYVFYENLMYVMTS